MASRTAHVAVGISHLASGVFVEANESFCRLFHHTREEIVGRTSAELGLWPDERQHERLIELIRRHGSVRRFEARYRNSLGETGDVEVSARVVTQGDESFLIGFLTEVTDRRELIDDLRATQTRLDIVLRASNILVFRQDQELRYTWVANPALGASEADVIGRTDAEIMGADAAEPLTAIKRRVLHSGLPERRDVWVANQGQLGCFDLVVEPDRDAAGQVVGIICAAQDITERMTAQRRALSAPVIAIQGMSALIGREALTARQAQRLRRIDREVGQLARQGLPIAPQQRLQLRHAGTLVLVAEQNPVLGVLLKELLEQAGLRVLLAETGVEAFSFTLQFRPAMLLIDMEMPQSGGVAAARAVRTMLPGSLPIVAMMSQIPLASVTQVLDVDLDDVLDKPVAAASLYEKVLSWLEAR